MFSTASFQCPNEHIFGKTVELESWVDYMWKSEMKIGIYHPVPEDFPARLTNSGNFLKSPLAKSKMKSV
jgi:hypothetical protein